MTARKPEKDQPKQSNFFDDVYEVVRLIPSGRATSYGAIAAYLGSKRGARMVGWAMASSYTAHGVPAHRVVNQAGMLSAKLLFETPYKMQELLENEGIVIKNDKIQNWKNVFWDPDKELN